MHDFDYFLNNVIVEYGHFLGHVTFVPCCADRRCHFIHSVGANFWLINVVVTSREKDRRIALMANERRLQVFRSEHSIQ